MNDLDYALKVAQWSSSDTWKEEVFQLLTPYKELIVKGDLLDVGCNTGALASFLGELSILPRTYTGLDVNERAIRLAEAKTYAMDARFFCVDSALNSYAFLDRYYTFIFVHHTLAHVENPVSFLSVLRRSISMAGVLISTTPNLFYDAFMTPVNVFTGYKSDPTIRHYFYPGSLIRAVKKAGFAVEKVFFLGEKPKGFAWIPSDKLRSRMVLVARWN